MLAVISNDSTSGALRRAATVGIDRVSSLRSLYRPQLHPGEALVEPWIGAQAVPLRRDRERGQRDALGALAAVDARMSQVVELRFFGGLSVEETADVLNVSPETVMRDWRTAKAWLLRELRQPKRTLGPQI